MWRPGQENPEFEASLISDNHCRMRFDKRREPKLEEILHNTFHLYGYKCSAAKLNALNPESPCNSILWRLSGRKMVAPIQMAPKLNPSSDLVPWEQQSGME